MKRVIVFSVVGASLLLIVAVFSVGLLIGLIVGEQRVYYRTFLEEQQLVLPIINQRPEFDGIIIDRYSAGGIYIRGWVKSANDLETLRNELARVFGEAKALQLMERIEIKEPAKDR